MAGGLPGPLTVGAACSGLKLAMASLMVSWFMAYVFAGAWWRKAVLVAASLPLSMMVNSLRVLIIGVVGLRTGSAAAMASVHDWSGYICLGLCAALLFLVAVLANDRRQVEW